MPAQRAIADGNKLILGPLLRDDVADVLARARAADVPLITFSNDISIARADAFVMGHVPEQSIARTVAYAARQGARDFAVLAPNGEYGQRALDALREALQRSGGTLVATQRYDRGKHLDRLRRRTARGSGGLRCRTDRRRCPAGRDGGRMHSRSPAPRGRSSLGPELWSGEDEVARASAMRGAWFSSVSDDRYRQFVDSYQARFGSRPYRIATLGYDSVLAGPARGPRLEAGRGFSGIATARRRRFPGDRRSVPLPQHTGVGERAMEVRQVGNGSVSVVSPAPKQFD